MWRLEDCRDCLKLQVLTLDDLVSLIESIPPRVREADGLNHGFTLMRIALTKEGTSLFDAAIHSMHTVLDLVADDGEFVFSAVAEALQPLVEEAYMNEDFESRRLASWVTALWASHSYSISFTIPHLMNWIKDGPHDLRVKAAWNFLEMSQMEEDLSDVVELLEDAMRSDDWTIRHYSSEALSKEYARSGDEEDLKVDESVYEKEQLDSDWSVLVRHRRSHAMSDEIMEMPPETAHFHALRHCAVCCNPKAECIWYADDSGPSWRECTCEYFCHECGKYTIYRYFD